MRGKESVLELAWSGGAFPWSRQYDGGGRAARRGSGGSVPASHCRLLGSGHAAAARLRRAADAVAAADADATGDADARRRRLASHE